VNEDRASRYHRLKRQASIIALVWSLVLLGGLMTTGLSVSLRNTAESIASRLASARWEPALTVVAYVLFLSILNEIGSIPLGFYSGFALERQYGLSNETFGSWLRDHAVAFGVGLVLAWGGVGIIYLLIRMSPDRWWLAAGAAFALLIIGITNLAPVVLLPLFYTVKPLDRESLCARLMALAGRAGARVLGAYEWGLADKTKKANAALTGIGGTRRILISDTMLAEYSDEEIEVVLAHELAHHVHNDIWKAIMFESVLILVGFFLASRALAALAGFLGLRGVSDIAGLPLLLLAAGAVSFVMMPVAQAMSRAHERRADRFALALTNNPSAFVSAMRRLGAQNLAEEHPSKLVQWLFYSHPPLRERIAAAQEFTQRG
jgi:Zn-dependent protease with chaperone function